MSQGTWFAYCAANRLMPLDEIARPLATDSELTTRLDQPNLLIVTVHDGMTGHVADVTITIDKGTHVALEAAELAAALASGRQLVDKGVPAPDQKALAAAAARYELTWELRFSDETYNAMMVIAGLLTEECGAIVYDITNARFV